MFCFCVKEKETKNCVCQQKQQLKEVVGKIVLKMVDKRKNKIKRKLAGYIPTRDCFNHSKYLTK